MEGNLIQKSTNLLGGWKTVRWFELERAQLVPRYDAPHILAEEAAARDKATDEKAKKEAEAKAATRQALQRRASSKPGLAPQLELDGATVTVEGKDTFILKKKGWANPEMVYKMDEASIKDPVVRERERDAWVAALQCFKAAPPPPRDLAAGAPGYVAAYQQPATPTTPADGSSSPKEGGAAAAGATTPASPRGSQVNNSKFYVFPEVTVKALQATLAFLQEKKSITLGAPDPAAVTQVVAITRSLLGGDEKYKIPPNTVPTTVAAVTRVLLKRLPETLFSTALMDQFVTAAVDAKIDDLRALVGQLPTTHRELLQNVLITARVFNKDSTHPLSPAGVAHALGPALTPQIEDEAIYTKSWKDKMIGLFTVLMQSTDAIFDSNLGPLAASSPLRSPTTISAATVAALDSVPITLDSTASVDAKSSEKPPAGSGSGAEGGKGSAVPAEGAKDTAAAAAAAGSAGDKDKNTTAADGADKDKTTASTDGKPANGTTTNGTGAAAATNGTTAETGKTNGDTKAGAEGGGDKDKENKSCRMCTNSCTIM